LKEFEQYAKIHKGNTMKRTVESNEYKIMYRGVELKTLRNTTSVEKFTEEEKRKDYLVINNDFNIYDMIKIQQISENEYKIHIYHINNDSHSSRDIISKEKETIQTIKDSIFIVKSTILYTYYDLEIISSEVKQDEILNLSHISNDDIEVFSIR
jgi:hypothetical protein